MSALSCKSCPWVLQTVAQCFGIWWTFKRIICLSVSPGLSFIVSPLPEVTCSHQCSLLCHLNAGLFSFWMSTYPWRKCEKLVVTVRGDYIAEVVILQDINKEAAGNKILDLQVTQKQPHFFPHVWSSERYFWPLLYVQKSLAAISRILAVWALLLSKGSQIRGVNYTVLIFVMESQPAVCMHTVWLPFTVAAQGSRSCLPLCVCVRDKERQSKRICSICFCSHAPSPNFHF